MIDPVFLYIWVNGLYFVFILYLFFTAESQSRMRESIFALQQKRLYTFFLRHRRDTIDAWWRYGVPTEQHTGIPIYHNHNPNSPPLTEGIDAQHILIDANPETFHYQPPHRSILSKLSKMVSPSTHTEVIECPDCSGQVRTLKNAKGVSHYCLDCDWDDMEGGRF